MPLPTVIMDSDDEESADEVCRSDYNVSPAVTKPPLQQPPAPMGEIPDTQYADTQYVEEEADGQGTDVTMPDAPLGSLGVQSQSEDLQHHLKQAHAALLASNPSSNDTPSSDVPSSETEPNDYVDMSRKRPNTLPSMKSASPPKSRSNRNLSEFDFDGSDDELSVPAPKRAKTDVPVKRKKRIEHEEVFVEMDNEADESYEGGGKSRGGEATRRVPTRGTKKEEPLLMLAMRKARGKAALKTVEQPETPAILRNSPAADLPSSNDTTKTGDTAMSALEQYREQTEAAERKARGIPSESERLKYAETYKSGREEFPSSDYVGTPTQPIDRNQSHEAVDTPQYNQQIGSGSSNSASTVPASRKRTKSIKQSITVEVPAPPARSLSIGASSGDESAGKRRRQKLDEEVMSSLQAAAASEFGLRKKRNTIKLHPEPYSVDDEDDELIATMSEVPTPKLSKRSKTTGDVPGPSSEPVKAKKVTKAKGKAAKTAKSAEILDDSDEDIQTPVSPVKKSKAKTTAAAKKAQSPKKTKKPDAIVIDDSDEESDLSPPPEESDDEELVVKKPSPKRKAKPTKATKPASPKVQRGKKAQAPKPIEDDAEDDIGPLSQDMNRAQIDSEEKENVEELEEPETPAKAPSPPPPPARATPRPRDPNFGRNMGQLVNVGKSLADIFKSSGPQRRVGLSNRSQIPSLLSKINRPKPPPDAGST